MAELMSIPATPYLSVVIGRKPEQKLHKRLSDAKNAFDTPKPNLDVPYPYRFGHSFTHGWGALYEQKDGKWELLYEIPKPTEADGYEGKHRTEYETRPWKLEKK